MVGPSLPVPSAAPSGAGTDALNAIAQQFGIPLTGGGATSTLNKKDPPIYLSFGHPETPGALNANLADTVQSRSKTLGQMLAEFDSEKPEEQRKLGGFLALAGYLGNSTTYSQMDLDVLTAPLGDVRAAYENFLKDVQSRQTGLNQTVTPDQLLQQSIAYRLAQNGTKWDGSMDSLASTLGMKSLTGATLDGKSPKLKTITQTSKSVNFVDPQDAKAAVRNMLQQQLGRDPSDAEYEDFLAMLHQAEATHPATTTQTTTYDPTDPQQTAKTQSTVTQQGINAQGLDQMMYDHLKNTPSWAEWQAVGTYAPALFSALGSAVPGVK